MENSTKFRKKMRSRAINPNAPHFYNYDEEKYRDFGLHNWKTLYDKAEDQERERTFGGQSALSPEKQLEALQEEIKVRVRITKNEIFKIGELLIYAKGICQQEGKKFQKWIKDNLDFSYETANNFINVYEQCLGQRAIAMNVKPSILYKISAPSFPDELRKYLFDAGQLDEITNGQLREITLRYKAGGFETIKDDIKELNRGFLVNRQSLYTLDVVESALRTLEGLKEKIVKGRSGRDSLSFEDQIKTDQPEAFEVNSKLISALQYAIDLLDKAREESNEILSNTMNRLCDKCGVVEPDGRREKREQAEFDAKSEKIERHKM